MATGEQTAGMGAVIDHQAQLQREMRRLALEVQILAAALLALAAAFLLQRWFDAR